MGDPNRRYRLVVNTPSVFPQVPNYHHQVYDVPTVFAEDANHHHHHHQVYEIPTVFADVPNHHHHQPLVFPNQQQHPPFEINVPTAVISVTPRAMISVVDYYLPDDTHNLYDVTFDTHTIHTLLTSSPSHVDFWLSDTFLHNRHRNNLDARMNSQGVYLEGQQTELGPNSVTSPGYVAHRAREMAPRRRGRAHTLPKRLRDFIVEG